MAELIKEGLIAELDGFLKVPRALSKLTNIRTSLADQAVMGGLERSEAVVVYDRLTAAEDRYEALAKNGSIFHLKNWDKYVREENQTPRPFDIWWEEQVQRDINYLAKRRSKLE